MHGWNGDGFLGDRENWVSVICKWLQICESYAEATDVPLDQIDCVKDKLGGRFKVVLQENIVLFLFNIPFNLHVLLCFLSVSQKCQMINSAIYMNVEEAH